MLVGIPKESKEHELRVGLTPESVAELTQRQHSVIIQTGAGYGIRATDADYRAVGAEIAADMASVYQQADMIVKVKEPQAIEWPLMREDQTLFCYLHLAPDSDQARALIKAGVVAVAFETVTSANGGLPLLAPMSEIAGRLSLQAAAYCLESAHHGKGILLGGVPGVGPAKVLIIGGGTVGTHAAHIAIGMGATTWVIDSSVETLRALWRQFGRPLNTNYSTQKEIERHVLDADVVIGSVLIPGAKTPRIVSTELVKRMRPGSVVVDVSVDQGGCIETARPTTHGDPYYVFSDVVHYCVSNMPGAVPRTSTYALNNVILPYVLTLADKGYRRAMLDDQHFCNGLNIFHGKVTHPAVASALGYGYTPAMEALAG